MSKAKQKGTAAETALVKFLQKNGFPGAERRALGGGGHGEDLGDVAGTVGIAWEVKNQRQYNFHQWLRETELERIHSRSDYGILVVKPNGIGLAKPEDFWAIMPISFIVDLLREAGYGDAK